MDIAQRFESNPILSPADIGPSLEGMKIECLLNPGVFRWKDQVWLLLRVAERPTQEEGTIKLPVMDAHSTIEILSFSKDDPDLDHSDPRIIVHKGRHYLTTISHLRLVNSEDGRIFKEPEGFEPIMGQGMLETYGIEDCRVAFIDSDYHLTYTQVSAIGVGVGYIQTRDWKNFSRMGMIFPPHNKDCALFEEKINNQYYALHRPSSPELGGNYIWLAASPDLKHWGHHQCIATTRPGHWDSARVGAGGSPIKTEEGWLEIYHGADHDHRYCLGALLMSLDNPAEVLARSDEPIMEPLMDYERKGFFGNVVFTNGHLVEGDNLTIYYGASDEVICGAEFSIDQILKTLK